MAKSPVFQNVPLPSEVLLTVRERSWTENPRSVVLISQKWPTMLEAAAARSHRLAKVCRVFSKCAVETTAGRLTKFSCMFGRTADRLTLRFSWLSFILYLLTNALPWMRLPMYLGGKAEETPFLQRPGSFEFQAKRTKESPNQQIKQHAKWNDVCCMLVTV